MKKINAIGLMSGTSADGINAAIIEVEGRGFERKIKLLTHKIYPFSKEMRRLILDLSATGHGTTELVCHLNFLLGKQFALAAIKISEDADISMDDIKLIGSHGQTICHIPKEIKGKKGKDVKYGYRTASTLQLGEPSVIAELTGVTTVADFRPRDIAAEGEGAPLTPFAHRILFGKMDKPIVINNLGGISNVTYLPKDGSIDDIIAFDTGPGNLLIDSFMNMITQGKKSYDRNGALAKKGHVNELFLEKLMQNAYFKKTPPKSTGRENFGLDFSQMIYNQGKVNHIPPNDLLATITAFTSKSISMNYQSFILSNHPIEEAIFCGGGVRNKTLMDMLKKDLSPIPVKITDDYDIPAEAVESMSFAILAHATILGEPTSVISATGATRRTILGKIIPGKNGFVFE